MGLTLNVLQLVKMIRERHPEAFPEAINLGDPLRIRFSTPEFDESRLKREVWSSVDGWDVMIAYDHDQRLYEIAIGG